MRFQVSSDSPSVIVYVKKREFALASGRSNAPTEFPLGTINTATGKVDAWPPPYPLATQSRNRPDLTLWAAAARAKLAEIAPSSALARAMQQAREEESRTGDFLVRVSDGSHDAFHSAKRAYAWAELRLAVLPNGSRAEFFRRPPEGIKKHLSGPPWTEPFGALEKNEYGHIKHAGIRRAG
jgi:hypothetical protein